MPSISSERVSVKRRASVASRRAYASAPIAVAWNRPRPATAMLPDNTSAPSSLVTGSDSPVSIDSSSSSPSTDCTIPSATTWSPARRSQRSPSTTSVTSISRTSPSRTTRARGALSTASRSRVRLARYSWTTPMRTLNNKTIPNRPSWPSPNTRMSTNAVPRIALNRVKTLARRISENFRLVRSSATLTCPARTRCATSSARSPSGPVVEAAPAIPVSLIDKRYRSAVIPARLLHRPRADTVTRL